MKVYRNFKVLVDLDDTLTNLLQAWVDYLNRKHGLKVDYKNVNSETKVDRWAVEVPDEEEITILMKQSEISLKDFWNETVYKWSIDCWNV